MSVDAFSPPPFGFTVTSGSGQSLGIGDLLGCRMGMGGSLEEPRVLVDGNARGEKGRRI